MADLRLNGVIRALEAGRPAFTCFSVPEVDSAYAMSVSKFDGVVFEMEHNPWDGRALRADHTIQTQVSHSCPLALRFLFEDRIRTAFSLTITGELP
jgi:hypothetical protein